MRIKKLELFGFKSFKDRTVIHFDEGITGIVGPNGCGKSNIVDALVWVMGEMSAKHLRGSSMSDVIFAGAEGFAPMGMAEVNLTLENDGGPFPVKYLKHSEVMVTRRLHRSGDSEYLINKEPARLRDIQEIFMDTGAGSKGFSIIEQGKIGEIITAKPEQRRTLIEEAAGITKFKVRKRESQRKLTQTDQNLVRLADIIGEQKRQLDSLQRQAQRAERYRKLKQEAEEKEIWLSSKQYLGLHSETEVAQKIFDEAQAKEVEASAQLADWEANAEKMKTELSEKENLVNSSQQRYSEARDSVSQKENQIREFNFEIEQARRNKEMTGSILEKYKVRKDALTRDQIELEDQIATISEESSKLNSDFEAKNSEYIEVQQRIEQADHELTQARREMLTVSQSESHLSANQVSVEASMTEKKERLENERNVLDELRIKKDEFEKRRKTVFDDLERERQLQLEITRDLDVLGANLSGLDSQIEVKHSEVEEQKDQLNEISSRLYGLEDLHTNFEGFQEGVKNVMLWQRQRQETHADGSVSFQPVAEVVEVPKEYEMVMEAALGTRLQMLLSQDRESSLQAVDYLKENNSGRSSFYSADESHSDLTEKVDSLRGEEGVNQLLVDVVSVPEKYKSQINYVLSEVVIVDSIRTALRLRPLYPQHTFVTMEGDSLSRDGVLTGGTAESAETGVLKRRREIKELSMLREEAAGKLALAQTALDKLQGQQKQIKKELEEAKEKQSEKERRIISLEKDFERADNELDNARRAWEKQNQQTQKEDEALQALTLKHEELVAKIAEIRQQKYDLEKKVDELDRELAEKRRGIEELQETVSRLRSESAVKRQELSGKQSQMEMLQASIDEVDDQLKQMTEETERSTHSLSENQVLVEEAQVELEKLIREAKESEEFLSQIKDEFEIEAKKVRELEEKVNALLHAKNQSQSQMNDAQLKLEQFKMKEQYLIDQINEKYMKDLSAIAQTYENIEGDVKETEAELDNIKGKLKRIGEVNLSAIEEYDELISRYEFMKQQQEDLTEAKEQLRRVIERINRICSRRFKDTFEQVNERFEKVFPVLFGGGHARLILVEDPEKGEMGIDIIAQPPGKKAANVSLLSGGEKALTAVSLIFSIFLVKPSPYCLLDEVDAPLDDANVHRFNDLVKEMAKRSQIILVTHNKHTMRVNNKLFGVTQENKGVSKMVSVSLAEAERVVEA